MKQYKLRCNLQGVARLHETAEKHDGITISYGRYNADKSDGTGHKSYPLEYTVHSKYSALETAKRLQVRLFPKNLLEASSKPYDNEKISTAPGNSKLGTVCTVSTMPGDSCMPNAPCLHDCYACANALQYPGTLAAYAKNQRIINDDIPGFWAQFAESVAKWSKSDYARPFVAGDMVVYDDNGEVDVEKTQVNIDKCFEVIAANPGIKWAQYTKAYTIDGLDWSRIPDNHNLFFSTGWNIDTPASMPDNALLAVCLPDGHPELPDRDRADVVYCPCDDKSQEESNCTECEHKCYRAKELGITTVVFLLQTKWAAMMGLVD